MEEKELKIGWIDIISKMYKDLHNTESVLHSSSIKDKKRERLIKYFDRLEEVHKKVSKSKRKSDELILKSLYYKLYVIKEEDIEERYYQNQARILRERGYGNIEISEEEKKRMAKQIIDAQKESLDKWIEYFLYDEESKSYEMWEKYWVFQGIKSLGKYDKETGKFSKRNKSTTYPFPPVEREYVFTTLKLMEEYIKNKSGEEEIKSALGSGNFKQLYEFVIKQSMIKGKHQGISTEGKWIKYEQGSDYNKLRDSLQGYYTGWCTAAGENFAKSQLKNGDFYVYYSLNEKEEAKVPRIAIRMDGKTKIGEIRGIANNQNMEAEMMPILKEKLKEFPDRDKYYKKEKDMNMLTLIDNKVNYKKELTQEELRFLYEIDNKIEGFGHKKDPRINEIKRKRNIKKDYAEIFNVSEEEVALTEDEWRKNSKNIKVFPGYLDLSALRTVENLVLPKIFVKSIDLYSLTTAEGLELPQIIGGSLDLGSLPKADGLKLPKIIGDSLDLNSLETSKGLILPEKLGKSIDLSGLKTAEGLTLPQTIEGNLYLSSLETAEGLTLPQTIEGSLDLSGLKSSKNLVLPQSIGKSLNLYSLKTAKGLVLPQRIGESLNLGNLETPEGLVLPQTIEGSLNLGSLTTIKNLIMPQSIKRDLYLNTIETAEGCKMPQTIGGDLYLNNLKTTKGLILPQSIEGSLNLGNLETAEDLILPQSIGSFIDLSSLETAEGLVLPQSIKGFLDLSSLETAKGLVLPQTIEGFLDLSSLGTVEGLKLPQSIGGSLYLSGLETAVGCKLPETIGEDLYLNNLKTVEGLIMPLNIERGLYLDNLETVEGLKLPYKFKLNNLVCNEMITKEIITNPDQYYMKVINNELIKENKFTL